jgi:hypothetical protein
MISKLKERAINEKMASVDKVARLALDNRASSFCSSRACWRNILRLPDLFIPHPSAPFKMNGRTQQNGKNTLVTAISVHIVWRLSFFFGVKYFGSRSAGSRIFLAFYLPAVPVIRIEIGSGR